MYTRSYPKHESPKKPAPSEETFQVTPMQQTLTDENIPAGYCGTAILREKEKNETESDKPQESSFSPTEDTSFPPHSRVRKFKVATKITPSLWTEKEGREEGRDNTAGEKEKENVESLKATPPHEEGSSESCCKETFSESSKEEEEKGENRLQRKKSHLGAPDKHRFKRTPTANLRDRSFSLEDLLLGGLILLLLNEGADDDIILIFGFLLFSRL